MKFVWRFKIIAFISETKELRIFSLFEILSDFSILFLILPFCFFPIHVFLRLRLELAFSVGLRSCLAQELEYLSFSSFNLSYCLIFCFCFFVFLFFVFCFRYYCCCCYCYCYCYCYFPTFQLPRKRILSLFDSKVCLIWL